MPKITAIKLQKKEGRFNVYLDGKFAFGIDEETLVRENLKVGQEVSSRYTHKLVYGATVEKLVDKALRFLSFRPRSEKEVRDYLWKKARRKKVGLLSFQSPTLGNSGSLIDEVIVRLKDLGYVDDKAFVSWWLEQRIRFRPRGKMLLRSELFAKGIDRDLIEEELSKYSTEDELSWAKRVLEKRVSRWDNKSDFKSKRKVGLGREERKKLSSHLARRGFTWEVIEEIIDSSAFSL